MLARRYHPSQRREHIRKRACVVDEPAGNELTTLVEDDAQVVEAAKSVNDGVTRQPWHAPDSGWLSQRAWRFSCLEVLVQDLAQRVYDLAAEPGAAVGVSASPLPDMARPVGETLVVTQRVK